MAHFTNPILLSTRLPSGLIDLLKKDGTLEQALRETDADVFLYTGLTPSEESNNNSIVSAASDMVVWRVTGRQSGLTLDERKLRETKNSDAYALLTKIKDGELKLPGDENKTQAHFHSEHRRVYRV